MSVARTSALTLPATRPAARIAPALPRLVCRVQGVPVAPDAAPHHRPRPCGALATRVPRIRIVPAQARDDGMVYVTYLCDCSS